MKYQYKEYRCVGCNKLLFKGILVDSEVEIKCRGCSQMNTIAGERGDDLLCMIPNCSNRIHAPGKKK